jgi:hypothetical protein
MNQHKTIAVGGVQYDAHTGLPLPTPETEAETTVQNELRRVQSVHAKGIHKSLQRSTSLNRQFVAKTAKPRPTHSGKHADIMRPALKRSPHITKFAPSYAQHVQKTPVVSDIGPVAHPAVKKAHAQLAAANLKPRQQSAAEIKKAVVEQALANAKPATQTQHQKKSRSRLFSVVSAGLAVLLLAGYFTYINLPNLSVRVAAAQAGINASYPSYRPIGYSLNGPVAYQAGQVTMQFRSNSGPQRFALAQAKSSWDSTALLEKFVNPHSHGKYATYSDAGLTIYTYAGGAAWVNGGIMYSVDGTADLSNDQVQRIATSM